VNLWEHVERQAAHAVEAGALHHIETVAHLMEDGGVPFVVRQGTGLVKKETPGSRTAGDPFATPEPELFVADLSPTHYALLNKYNVLDRHLLVVTRVNVSQDEPLDAGDFESLARCMEGQQVLGFYNGGATGGASQPHKHLQVVRLPLSPFGCEIPVEALMAGNSGTVPGFPMRHAFARGNAGDPKWLLGRYHDMRRVLALEDAPYNLLVARDWMLLVPRVRAMFGTIPLNSLAFAGALFVRDEEELHTVERIGPMAALRGVAFPKDPS